MRLPIALPILRLGDRWLYRAGMFLLGFGSSLVMIGDLQPVLAQVSTTLTNTASGNFRQNPESSAVPVTSNPTTVPAQLFVLPRPALAIIKTGDRSTAEPGDTVIYRLQIRNTGAANAQNILITDTLPIGLKFLPNTVRAGIATAGTAGTLTPISVPAPTLNGRSPSPVLPPMADRASRFQGESWTPRASPLKTMRS